MTKPHITLSDGFRQIEINDRVSDLSAGLITINIKSAELGFNIEFRMNR